MNKIIITVFLSTFLISCGIISEKKIRTKYIQIKYFGHHDFMTDWLIISPEYCTYETILENDNYIKVFESVDTVFLEYYIVNEDKFDEVKNYTVRKYNERENKNNEKFDPSISSLFGYEISLFENDSKMFSDFYINEQSINYLKDFQHKMKELNEDSLSIQIQTSYLDHHE